MTMLKKSLLWIFFVIFIFCPQGWPDTQEWQNLKDAHFVVYYHYDKDVELARRVLRKAEEYYSKIARKISYSRYSNFWTWDERVKIVIFPDQKTFLKNTGQPSWSKGYANRDSELLKSRAIVTYRQESEFIDGVLPHEISHLALKDFIGFDRKIPVWFEEGVAQLVEPGKQKISRQVIKKIIKTARAIPLGSLNDMDVRQEKNLGRVSIFYAQSLTLVDFLVTEYGNDAFGRLCKNLKSGKSFEDALLAAYRDFFDSLNDFEVKWLRHMTR